MNETIFFYILQRICLESWKVTTSTACRLWSKRNSQVKLKWLGKYLK